MQTTELGYLIDWTIWTETIALDIAAKEQLILTKAHWDFIYFLRRFYETHQVIPPQRLLIQAMKQEFSVEIASSSYLQLLFPGGALKQSTKIAGLPKPRHCL